MEAIHETILCIAFNLENQGQTITVEGIRRALELIQTVKLNIEEEIDWLSENGVFFKKNHNQFSLTEAGRSEAARINKDRTKEDFNRIIARSTASVSYLDYCEEIYGHRMYLFNMMDTHQLNYVLKEISICNSDTVLDLGCGVGSILNNLVEKYRCNGIGIDQLNESTMKTRSKFITYIKGDIDSLADYNLRPNITLSIDSLYFSSNLDGLIKALKDNKSNRMYLFYSQYILDEAAKDRAILHCDKTKLAVILQKNKLDYRVVEYSNNEYDLYINALKVLPKYKDALEQEGNGEIYDSKLRENRIGKELYEKGLASRYLYIIA